MVECGVVWPRSDRSVSHALKVALTLLEGHPLVDAVHAFQGRDDDGNEGGGIRILCSLHAVSAERYAFRPDDLVSVLGDGESVRVDRSAGRGCLHLCTSPRPPSSAASTRESSSLPVQTMLTVEGLPRHRSFPNLPSLTCDVLCLFCPTHWKRFPEASNLLAG